MKKFNIQPLDKNAMKQAKNNWDNIGKPLNSLGKLEKTSIQMAGIFGTAQFNLNKKAVVVMCADNGVVAQGVTQTGQEVTKIVAENMTSDKATVAIMAKQNGAEVFVVDIGIAHEYQNTNIINKNIMHGTNNLAKEKAMSKEQAIKAIETGIELVKDLKSKGYSVIGTGEMGIGNTTTSSAITACLLNTNAEKVTGKGAGLSSKGLEIKISVIKNALEMHKPDTNDMIDVLSKIGGLDIAGLVGVFIGGAVYRVPVVIDGFISSVAALVAVKIAPQVKDFIFASHVSKEPAGQMVLDALGLEAMLHLDMCLGEGTGAVMAFHVFETANTVYNQMSNFEEINVEKYQVLE
ncbi:MAG: nicotinate-nucleotide--dimethylbenzimidazole phosphoribosyltransferase [Clostridia bacterium]